MLCVHSFSDLYVMDTAGAAKSWSQVRPAADALVPPMRSGFHWTMGLLFGFIWVYFWVSLAVLFLLLS